MRREFAVSSNATWIPEKQSSAFQMWRCPPGPGQFVVNNTAVANNPFDWVLLHNQPRKIRLLLSAIHRRMGAQRLKQTERAKKATVTSIPTDPCRLVAYFAVVRFRVHVRAFCSPCFSPHSWPATYFPCTGYDVASISCAAEKGVWNYMFFVGEARPKIFIYAYTKFSASRDQPVRNTRI